MGDYDGLAVLVGLGVVLIQILYVVFLAVICCWGYALIAYLWGLFVDRMGLDVPHGSLKVGSGCHDITISRRNVYCTR